MSTQNPKQRGTKHVLPQTQAHHLLSKHCHVNFHCHPKSTGSNHTWVGSWRVTVWSRLVTVGHGPRPFNYVLGVYFGHARSRPVTVQHGHICDKKISQHATFFRHEKAHSMKSWGSINHDRISLLQSICSSQFIQQLRQMAISKIAMVIVCLLAVVHDCCLIKTETKQMNHIWGPHCFHQGVKET